MSIKILEQNGVENENIDGAAFNYFCAQSQDGILPGVLNECKVHSPASNQVVIETGEMIASGFRIKLLEPFVFSFTSVPSEVKKFQFILRLVLLEDRSVDVQILCRLYDKNLRKDSLFHSNKGTWETEICQFSYSEDGVQDLQRTIKYLDIANLVERAEIAAASAERLAQSLKDAEFNASQSAQAASQSEINSVVNEQLSFQHSESARHSAQEASRLVEGVGATLDEFNERLSNIESEGINGGTTVKVNGEAVSEFDADTKVDKVTSTASKQRLYCINTDGTQGIKSIGSSGYDIPVRAVDGNISLPLNVSYQPQYAVPKKYVDEKIGDIQSALEELHTYAQTLIGGGAE